MRRRGKVKGGGEEKFTKEKKNRKVNKSLKEAGEGG